MTDKRKSAAPRLADADLSRQVGRQEYEQRLAELQRQIARIQQAYLGTEYAAVILFEGWDAAGKGGTIRRLSAALDPRSFKVWPIAAPRKYYLDRHFLLRFMERLPPNGAITVFDRSWYGRVLVERIEDLTPRKRWKAAYREINAFERMLTDDGTRLVKLFYHISPDEQLTRLEKRIRDPFKRWKLSYEDFRNRERWQDYESAIDEMFDRTHTRDAPWHLIPANDKRYARLAAMKRIIKRLGKGVDLTPPPLDAELVAEASKHLSIEPILPADSDADAGH